MKLEFHKENNSSSHRWGSLKEAKMWGLQSFVLNLCTLYFEVPQYDDQSCIGPFSVFQLTTGSMLLMTNSSMRLW